jgi:hypothetical protein
MHPTDVKQAPPHPANQLLQMMTGYWISQSIYVVARLGIADLLAGGPRNCDEIAAITQAHGSSLYRVMRALASVGIFTEQASGTFSLTPTAELLRTGTPSSMRSLAMVYGNELYRAWGDFLHSVKTGQPAFDYHFGLGPFPYYAQHPDADRIFNEAMTGYTNQVANALSSTYDFSSTGTVVDVGGGYGTMIASILNRNPGLRGILFELPHVIAASGPHLADAGVADRCERIDGDFFTSVPPGGDVYILSQILHDWDDEHCVALLDRCRSRMPDHGRLLVVETVLPSNEDPSFGKWLDLHMLAITGGRERTAEEYGALFRATGFSLSNVIPTPAGPSIVEAVPAGHP